MTYTLKLSPEIEERVRHAQKNGIDVDARIVEALRSLPAEDDHSSSSPSASRYNPPANRSMKEILERNRPTPEAIAAFSAEVRTGEEILARMTPEEIAESERATNELLQALDQNRRDAGERPLYPE